MCRLRTCPALPRRSRKLGGWLCCCAGWVRAAARRGKVYLYGSDWRGSGRLHV